jgi:hypothetical protein
MFVTHWGHLTNIPAGANAGLHAPAKLEA